MAGKDFKKTAVSAALKSGKFLKNSLGKVREISYKGAINIVTDIDKKSEKLIVREIKKAFPDHAILAEEGGALIGYSPYKWIIDPLDGTTNFAHSFPFFCVSIALEKDGRIILGVVYDPMRKELFTAEPGKGARLNNRKIRVSGVRDLSKSLLATGFSYGVREARDDNVNNFKNFLKKAMAIRRAGSAALDLCYVACGRFDGYWEMDLHPWDTAAGLLIVREAGGIVTKCDGTVYSQYKKNILASNKYIHKKMLQVLKKSK